MALFAPLSVKNNAESTLNGAITAVATTLIVQAGEGARFPADAETPFHITLVDPATLGTNGQIQATSTFEIVSVTAVSTDTFTIVRAQQSTSGTAFGDNAIVVLNVTAKNIADINDALTDGTQDLSIAIIETDEVQVKDNTPRYRWEDVDGTATRRAFAVDYFGSTSDGLSQLKFIKLDDAFGSDVTVFSIARNSSVRTIFNTGGEIPINQVLNEYRIGGVDPDVTSEVGIRILSRAAEAWGVGAAGTSWEIRTTPNGSTTAALALKVNENKDCDVEGDLAVNGGAVTSSATTVELFDSVATTINFGGAATTLSVGAGAASTLNANFATLVSDQTTLALFDTVSTTINFGGAATAVTIGAATGTTTIDNDLTVNGGLAMPTTNKTTTYTATISDYLITADATGGAFTITLPAVAAKNGQILVIKKIDVSANAVTIDGDGAETIDDAATQALSSQYDALMIQNDGTEWWII